LRVTNGGGYPPPVLRHAARRRHAECHAADAEVVEVQECGVRGFVGVVDEAAETRDDWASEKQWVVDTDE
jgi:hypothetical protein